MARKKQKAKGSAGGLPKRIAGVKVPKAMRKGRFGALLTSPVGVKLMTDAIEAGVVFATRKGAKKGSPVRTFAEHPVTSARLAAYSAADLVAGLKHGAADRAGSALHGAEDAGDRLGHAFAEAARAFAAALHAPAPAPGDGATATGESRSFAAADSGPVAAEDRPAKKPSARATADDARPH